MANERRSSCTPMVQGCPNTDDISQVLDTETFTQDVEDDDELLIASSDSDSADSDYED